MRINLQPLAELLYKKGFRLKDLDTNNMDDLVLDYLVGEKFFDYLHDEMSMIQEENQGE